MGGVGHQEQSIGTYSLVSKTLALFSGGVIAAESTVTVGLFGILCFEGIVEDS